MRRDITRMSSEFAAHWHFYLCQSLLATGAIVILLLVLGAEHAFIIGSLGSTAFTVFAMPNNITARPRSVFGGHAAGLACGFLCSLLPFSGNLPHALELGAAVGLAMFLMVVLDLEHPPAAGTALGAAIAGYSGRLFATVLIGALVLVFLHAVLKRWMRDLV